MENAPENEITYNTDLSFIAVGDYLYFDGTYTSELDSANMENCSGCVYNLTTTKQEQNDNGWTHGHIVALKDAEIETGESEFEWGPINSEIPNATTYKEARSFEDGYWYCLLDSMCLSPAMSSLDNFDGKIFNVPLPKGSEWYIPTVADWEDIIMNLGGATLNEYSNSLTCYDNSSVAPILQKKIGAFPHKKGKKLSEDDYSYWTCIQQGEEISPDGVLPRAWAVYGCNESGHIGNSPTTNKMKVRPVSGF